MSHPADIVRPAAAVRPGPAGTGHFAVGQDTAGLAVDTGRLAGTGHSIADIVGLAGIVAADTAAGTVGLAVDIAVIGADTAGPAQ